jgi:amino acid transporter
MFKDIRVFIMIILICITGFAVMIAGGRTSTKCLPSDDVQAVHGFCLTYWWWLRTYFMGYGEIPMDELQDAISLVVACVAMLIVHLILMNTAFVAMITSSFDAVMVQSKENWMISQYYLTEDYIEWHTTIMVPFNLIYHVPRFLISILSWLVGRKWDQSVQIREHKRREV